MRIESCRKCGSERKPIEQKELVCPVCRKPTKFVCTECEDQTEIQFHVHLDEEKVVQPLPIIISKKY